MYTAEEREQIIDIVDKMSLLRQDFDGAFTWIKENVSMPFDFDGTAIHIRLETAS